MDNITIDGVLLAQVQAAFWKQKAMEMRIALLQNDLDRAHQDMLSAAATSQGLLSVINNKYEVKLGEDANLDIETGQITKRS